MIDLHCHILPGIDDGAQSLEDALIMAQSAVKNGVTHILCTPHHNNGRFVNPSHEIIQHVASFQKELDAREIPLTLFEGQEVRITGDLLEEIVQKRIQFIDIDNHYVLIEFPTMDIPAYAEQIFFDLLAKSITPIIVHPERNSKFIENPNRLIEFLSMGCLAQLTAPSYIGIFGKKIKKIAFQMVQHNLVQMMASDAHNVAKRDFFMKEAYEAIAKDFGEEKVERYKQVAKDIVNGDYVVAEDYSEVKVKKFIFF